MATIKIVITKKQPLKNGLCVIYVQLSAHNKTLRVPTEIHCHPDHFENGIIKGGKKGDELAQLKNIRINEIKSQCDLMVINNQAKIKEMDVKALKKFLFDAPQETTTDFFKFSKGKIQHYREQGQESSADTLSSTVEKVKQFWPSPLLDMAEINVRFLEQFERFCKTVPNKKGKTQCVNGVAVYMRYIRSMMNDAIDDELITNYPFRKYKIKKEVTRNRNLDVQTIRKIRDYTPTSKREKIARDIFMFQIYCHGVNLIDVFYLEPKELVGDRLQFFRHKTRKYNNILLLEDARTVMDQYRGEKYLFWFADNCREQREVEAKPHSRKSNNQYVDSDSFTHMINENLGKIKDALKLDIPIALTDYAARHSFASISRLIGVSKDDISQMLTHSSPKMGITDVYINEDFARADAAQKQLNDYINERTEVKKPTRKKQPPVNS